MYDHFDERSGQKAPLIADDVYDIIMKVSIRKVEINSCLRPLYYCMVIISSMFLLSESR